jgi:cyclopropane fatty-acyl-phospholipid synthase-like methyltransferase
VSERLREIVEAMRVQPDDEILEIGCGHGVAATFICQKLRGGRLLAIDRSKKMIDAAVRRNKKYLEAGKADFRLADVMKFDPGSQRFDKILAVRVGLLHRDEDKARRHLEKWLKPKGKILLVYDEP